MRKVQPADYKLFQVADLICTMELTNDKAERNAFSKSEREFFHSARDFRKNLYKYLEKKSDIFLPMIHLPKIGKKYPKKAQFFLVRRR